MVKKQSLEISPELLDELENKLQERLTDWAKGYIKRGKTVIMGVVWFLTLLGASGFTWQLEASSPTTSPSKSR